MNDEDLLDKAKRRFSNASTPLRDERQQVLDDIRFCYVDGAQWEGKIGQQFENKLKLQVNKIMMAQTRIMNEYRQNGISISFLPKKGTNDKQADFVAGLYRADCLDSKISEAKDCAYMESSCGGYGAFRLKTVKEDEYDDEGDEQRIRFEGIPDAARSVYLDSNAKRQDKAEAKWGFIITALEREEYKDQYEDDPASWDDGLDDYGFDWADKDLVRIAEYFEIEDKKEMCYWLKSLNGEELKLNEADYDDQIETLLAQGYTVEKEKKIRVKRVHKWILSGGKILEDCGIIAGKNIPIVEVFGKRIIIDSIERTMGHVRPAKDAQRLKNMQLSLLGEASALSPTEKPIFTPDQVAGFENKWAMANIDNPAYMLLNPIADKDGNIVPTGPIGMSSPPSLPPATAALIQITEQDMGDILGRGDAGEDVVSGVSGKAVELIQSSRDGVAYGYLDNLGKAEQRAAEIWLSMAQDVYVEEGRYMKLVDKAEKGAEGKLMEEYYDEDGNTISNDISKIHVDISYEIGPSSESKRAAASRNILGMMSVTSDPESMKQLNALLLYNIEGEGMADIREAARKELVAMGKMKPTEQDKAEAAENPQEPSANDIYLKAEAERATAEAAKNRADTVSTIADAELKRAQAAKIMYDMQPAPVAPGVEAPKTYDEEKLMLEAQKVKSANMLKSREIAIKEEELRLKQKEMALRLAEKLAGFSESEEEIEEIEEVKQTIETQPDTAMDKLVAIMEAQQASRDKAVEMLGKPKEVVRKDGKIVGIK